MTTTQALTYILATANIFGGEMIAFLCISFTIMTTIGTFVRASLVQRLQRAWGSALGCFIFGSAMAISHAIQLPQQPTLFFNTKPLILLLVYAFCIALLSLCAIKASERYKYIKRPKNIAK
jgi:hypothetical protein